MKVQRLETLDGKVHTVRQVVVTAKSAVTGQTVKALRIETKCGATATGSSTTAKSTCC